MFNCCLVKAEFACPCGIFWCTTHWSTREDHNSLFGNLTPQCFPQMLARHHPVYSREEWDRRLARGEI